MHSVEKATKTKAQKKYLGAFFFRTAVLIYVLYIYFFHRSDLGFEGNFFRIGLLDGLLNKILVACFWVMLMVEMIRRMIPSKNKDYSKFKDIGSSKQFSYMCLPAESYDKERMRKALRKKDIGALKVLAVWFILGAVVLTLKLTKVFTKAEIILIWSLCYFLDVFCIVFFCPLQSFLMKNRCCTTCRIFRWDHFLTYTVLAFIPNFYSITLFAVSLVELAMWEWARYKHPERFWEGSNLNLSCKNCVDRTCIYKNEIKKKLPIIK